LQVLLKSLLKCVPVLMWSLIVLCGFLTFSGELFHIFLQQFISDDSKPLKVRHQVFLHFGSFSQTILTMFELTLANWVPVCRLLVDNVNMAAGYGVLLYKIVVGFAVIRIMVGVFLIETFKTASTDDELMALQAKRTQAHHAAKMKRFLREADIDGDGLLEADEFKSYLHAEAAWLAAQGLDEHDDDLLFNLLDDGDGKLEPIEVTKGIARLKGPARSIDVVSLLHMVSLLQDQFTAMATRLEATTKVAQSAKFEQSTLETAHREPNQNRGDLHFPLLAHRYVPLSSCHEVWI